MTVIPGFRRSQEELRYIIILVFCYTEKLIVKENEPGFAINYTYGSRGICYFV